MQGVNYRFKIAMFLRTLTYAQKWFNSYVFYTFIVHGNIMASQLFAPKLPLKIPFYFKISLTLFWIISCRLKPVNTLLTIAPLAYDDFVSDYALAKLPCVPYFSIILPLSLSY